MYDRDSGGDVPREMIRELGISPELETENDAPLVDEFEQLDDEFREAEAHRKAVSERAYEIWENDGRPHGRHEDHWHTAEQQIRDRSTSSR